MGKGLGERLAEGSRVVLRLGRGRLESGERRGGSEDGIALRCERCSPSPRDWTWWATANPFLAARHLVQPISQPIPLASIKVSFCLEVLAAPGQLLEPPFQFAASVFQLLHFFL